MVLSAANVHSMFKVIFLSCARGPTEACRTKKMASAIDTEGGHSCEVATHPNQRNMEHSKLRRSRLQGSWYHHRKVLMGWFAVRRGIKLRIEWAAVEDCAEP